MTDSSVFLNHLEEMLVPSEYRKKIVKNVPDGWKFFRKGAYIFAAVPYSSVPKEDYGNAYVKAEVRKIVLALPVILEKGLFLLYYGPAAEWKPHVSLHRVDKTSFRPVIMQSIHYVDPETGENYNNRTAWGPVQFGFCDQVILEIEQYCRKLARGNTPKA